MPTTLGHGARCALWCRGRPWPRPRAAPAVPRTPLGRCPRWAAVTVCCFGLGGLVYGPFNALSVTLFQAETPSAQLSAVLAVRSAALVTAAPVGAALGGPLGAAFGPHAVLAGSGVLAGVLARLAGRGGRLAG